MSQLGSGITVDRVRDRENSYPRVGQGKTDSLKAWQVEKGKDLGKDQGQKGRTQQKGEQIHRRVH